MVPYLCPTVVPTRRSLQCYTAIHKKWHVQSGFQTVRLKYYHNTVFSSRMYKYGIKQQKKTLRGIDARKEKSREKSKQANDQRKNPQPPTSTRSDRPSSRQSSTLQLQRLFCQSRKVHLLVPVLRHMFAGSNAVDSHFGVEFKTAEELWGDEEVLASAAAVFAGGGAGDVDEAGVDETEGGY